MIYHKILFQTFIFATLLFCISSCVKDGMPPDCKKPSKPIVQSPEISVNEGDSVQFKISGPSGAQYLWSGPDRFYSTSMIPKISNASISNSGTYWVKSLVGYCYSDSVPLKLTVTGDTTCNLGNNGADFPNGSSGPFTLITSCSFGKNGSYQINAKNADSTIKILVHFSQKPGTGGIYTIINKNIPATGNVFIQLTDQFNSTYTCSKGVAYIKTGNGKFNVVICQVKFDNIGVFCANIGCN